MSKSVEASTTTATINQLLLESTYSVYVLATSDTLPSRGTVPLNITIGATHCTLCSRQTLLGLVK